MRRTQRTGPKLPRNDKKKLAKECLDAKAKRGRTVTRDRHEPARERRHAKVQSDKGKETYNRRMHIGETPFAIIKGIFEVRRFLLRGLDKIRTEWRWVCTAYNLKKLMTALAALRAKGGEMALTLKAYVVGEGCAPGSWL